MVATFIAVAAAVVMSGVACRFHFKYKKLKDDQNERNLKLQKNGVYLEVLQQEREKVRESVRSNAATVAALMNVAYYSCDNFPKYQSNVMEKFACLYEAGALQGLTDNIVCMANLAENGAFYKLSHDFGLTELELRTCCFIYFGFKWQETCTADSLTENAYNVRCSRIRKKLGMEKEMKIPEFLENWCSSFRISSSEQ